MRTITFLLILILPIVLLAQTEQINEGWLKKDKSNFINLMSVLQSENHSFAFYNDIIENLDIRDNQEIGFGTDPVDFIILRQDIREEIIGNNEPDVKSYRKK